MLLLTKLARFADAAQALRQGISQGVNRIQTVQKLVPNDADFLFEHTEQLQACARGGGV